jgi:hypothetical protein
LSACTEEQVTDKEPTIARLYGEELHKIKVFEAVDSETKKTKLPVSDTTEKQHFNSNLASNIPAAAAFNFFVDAEDEERHGSRQVPTGVKPVNVAPDCLDLLMRKQSNWMINDDVIAASSKVLPKLSDTKPSLVSLQQQNHITSLIMQLGGRKLLITKPYRCHIVW